MSTAAKVVIAPSGVEARVRGSSVRAPMDPGAWEEAAGRGYALLEAPLREVIEKAGLVGRRVEVHYESADAVVEMLTLPLPFAEARAAGALRIRESLGNGAEACVSIARVPQPGADPGSSTLLMTADRSTTAEAIAAVVGRAGALPELLLPLRTTTLRAAIAAALAVHGERSATVMWMDRHTTAVAGGAGGSCRFARSLSAGCDLLVDAFRRAAREVGGCDHAQAWEMLFRAGIPRRDQVVDEGLLLKGERVIPLIQPALQRLAIEVKQTLRFGLPEGEASRAIVTLAGPGAAVPLLLETLGAMIETTVRPLDAAAGAAGERLEAGMTLGFTPDAVTARRARRGLLSAAAVGTAAAFLAVGLDGAWSQRETGRLNEAIAANERRLERAASDAAVQAGLDDAAGRLARLDALAEATIGTQTCWTAAMKLVSNLNVPGLELQEMVGGLTPDGPVLTLRGLVPSSDANHGPMAAVIAGLSASPLAARVQVGSARTVETDGGARTQFTIAMTLRTLSRTSLSALPDDRDPSAEARR